MKKIYLFYFFYLLFTWPVIADDANILQNRLKILSEFYAIVNQRVFSEEGNLIQEGAGELWIKHPNKFNLHIMLPDEIFLISDSQKLWIYDPLLEQVTVRDLVHDVEKTPFMLVICNSDFDVDKYHVNKEGDNFVLVPKIYHSTVKHITLNVKENGCITNMIVLEQNGRVSMIQMKDHKINDSINEKQFLFIPSEGITLDDQRVLSK